VPALAQASSPGRGIDREVEERDELPDAISSSTTRSRRRGSRPARVLARQRAEDELRHRHVGRRVDPVPGDVAEHDREPSVGELEEVVDVAADLDRGEES
jgi:hypothetical protein